MHVWQFQGIFICWAFLPFHRYCIIHSNWDWMRYDGKWTTLNPSISNICSCRRVIDWSFHLSTVFWLNQIDVCIASNFWCVDMHWVSIIFDALFARYIYNEHMCISWLIFIFIYGFVLNHVSCWKLQQRIKHVQIRINRIIFYCKWNRNYQTALSSDN